jgi:hypothetical protein
MRNLARRILSWLAGSLLLAIVFGVVGEFFTALAREKGWYQHPSERLDAAMNAFSPHSPPQPLAREDPGSTVPPSMLASSSSQHGELHPPNKRYPLSIQPHFIPL